MKPDGKPMRALRALEHTDRHYALSEHEVWVAARRDPHEGSVWHDALARLVRCGYAKRTGPRGSYRWFITASGKRYLKEELR